MLHILLQFSVEYGRSFPFLILVGILVYSAALRLFEWLNPRPGDRDERE